MPTASLQRNGQAIAIASTAITSDDLADASATWQQFAPVAARDLITALPIVRDLTTFEATIIGTTRDVELSPPGIASYTLDWNGTEWAGAGITLSKTFVLTLTTAAGRWVGAGKAGTIVLKSRTLSGAITISLKQSTLLGFIPFAPSRYRWNAATLRYIRPDGKLVQQGPLKQNVNAFVRDAGDELKTITRRMTTGDISIQEWQQGMASRVKSIHIAAGAVAKGGVTNLTARDIDRVQKVLDFQNERLLRFSEELSDLDSFSVKGELDHLIKPVVSDDAALSRSKLYAETARTTYEEAIAAAWGEKAATGIDVQMRNVLASDAEHCHSTNTTIGCVEESGRGWVTYGTMTLPSKRTCGIGCVCRVEYRRKPEN